MVEIKKFIDILVMAVAHNVTNLCMRFLRILFLIYLRSTYILQTLPYEPPYLFHLSFILFVTILTVLTSPDNEHIFVTKVLLAVIDL